MVGSGSAGVGTAQSEVSTGESSLVEESRVSEETSAPVQRSGPSCGSLPVGEMSVWDVESSGDGEG